MVRGIYKKKLNYFRPKQTKKYVRQEYLQLTRELGMNIHKQWFYYIILLIAYRELPIWHMLK